MISNIYYRDSFRILLQPRSTTQRSRLRLIAPAIPQPTTPNPRG
jgi:hypothetical protein